MNDAISSSAPSRRQIMKGLFALGAASAAGGCATTVPTAVPGIPASATGRYAPVTWIYDVGHRELRRADNAYRFTVHSGTLGIALPDSEIVAYSRHQNTPVAAGTSVYAADDSAFEIVPEVGAIPEGAYGVYRQDVSSLGRAVIALEKQPGTVTYGRGAFRIHVIEPDELGTAGCIGIPFAGQNGMSGNAIMAFLQQQQRSGQFRTLQVISSDAGLSRQMRSLWSEGHDLTFLRQHNPRLMAAMASPRQLDRRYGLDATRPAYIR